MSFNEQLPEWNNQGAEPPQAKKDAGWQPEEKPPADFFNWLFNRAYKVMQEIRSILSGHIGTGAPHSGHETPAGAQAKVDTHANQTAAHSATSTATASRIMMRDAAGRAKVAVPAASDDIARKDTVDAVQAAVDAHKADTMPHRFTDNGNVYKYGWRVEENDKLIFMYEEVI